jgi:hypothetical protein
MTPGFIAFARILEQSDEGEFSLVASAQLYQAENINGLAR